MYRIFFIISLLVAGTTLAQEPADSQIIEHIECRGNTHTSCYFLKRRLSLVEGELLSDERLNDAKLKLLTIPYLTNTSVFLERGSERDKVIIIIAVEDDNPYLVELAASGGYNSRAGFLPEIGFRVADQNFLGTGKTLDFVINAVSTNYTRDFLYYTANVRFIDPNLFGSNNYFLSTSIQYSHSTSDFGEGEWQFNSNMAIFEIGRRLGNFYYFTAGVNSEFAREHQTSGFNSNNCAPANDPFCNGIKRDPNLTNGFTSFGWNTENDYYFPTHGSQFNFIWRFGLDKRYSGKDNLAGFSYRKHWRTNGGSIWTLSAEGVTEGINLVDAQFNPIILNPIELSQPSTNNVSLRYARPFSTNSDRRARWYVEAGIFETYDLYDFEKGHIAAPRLELGLRVKTKHLGIVSFGLYLSDEAL